MKKILALILAIAMLLCICGCNSDNNTSSQETMIEYQEIVIDETGSTITQTSQETTTSETNTSSAVSDTSTVSSVGSIIDSYKNMIVEADICDDVIRGYLSASDSKQQYYWLSTYEGMKYDYQKLSLEWYRDGSTIYTVHFSENSDFSNEFTIQTKYSEMKNSILIPGKTYYYKVTGTVTSDVLGSGQINVNDAPVRWIKIDGTGNVRDMGGWKAEGGKTVKYGMLYRGRNLDDIGEDGIETIKQLGLKTELDLRYLEQKFQKESTGMNYVFLETNVQYDNTLTGDPDNIKANYRKIFELLSDESNYPFYTHCSAGADRTGAFAFITNGVLGVSYEDLTRDFELTSFSSSGKRWREDGSETIGDFTGIDGVKDGVMEVKGNYVAWGKLYDSMMNYGTQNGCTTLQESIEHWLINYIGVKQSQIDSFKNIMLG